MDSIINRPTNGIIKDEAEKTEEGLTCIEKKAPEDSSEHDSAAPCLTDLSSTASAPSGLRPNESTDVTSDATSSITTKETTETVKRKKNSSKGRHGDPRMHRAVAARLLNPELSLLESLLEGGFTFPEGTEGSGKSDRNIHDSDGVLLCQRKNQLSRRLRLAKKRQIASRAEGGIYASGVGGQDNDSRTIQNMLLNGQLPIPGSEQQVPMMRSCQMGGFVFPTQGVATTFDPSALQGNNESRGLMKNRAMENNFDQYLQLAVGLRPDQMNAMRHQGNMYPAFPHGASPFQAFPTPHQQMPQNFLGGMDPIQAAAVAGLNTGKNMPPNMQNMQNMQMNPMLTGNPGQLQAQAQMNADLSRLFFNRSMHGMNPGNCEADDENGQNR